jgi:acetamidase/formamidase
MTPTEAYAYLSIRTDFDVTEVVDITKGIHALIPKRDFGAGQPGGREERGRH